MKTKLFIFGVLGFALLAMSSCKADVDLNNMDQRVEMSVGLALPIGSMHATIGDFIKDSTVKNLYIRKGVLTYIDTFSISRQYHDVDLAAKISKTTKKCDVHQALDDQGLLVDNKITGAGVQIPLHFPFVMKLEGINEDEDEERLDSAQITNAKFVSNISTEDLGLDPSWIDKVTITLGDEFTRAEGKEVVVFDRNAGQTFAYNTDIPININEFTVCLMKNRHPATNSQYYKNVIDSCQFYINFFFTIPTGVVVPIPNDARFAYNLQVQFIDYKAIWGYFSPSNQMRDESVIDLTKEIDFWHNFKKAKLPFSDPLINMYTTTKVAGALVLNGDYLYTKEIATGDSAFATFNGRKEFRKDCVEGQPSAYCNYDNGYLPLNSTVGDSCRAYIDFNNDPAKGHIDQLFAIRPDLLGYKFNVEFNPGITPQIRVVPNTFIRVDAELIAPLKFNKGMELEYEHTEPNVQLSKLSLDSLLAEVKAIDSVEAANLTMVLAIENRIPLHIQAICKFLDKDSNLIMDPSDPTKPLRFGDSDTVQIATPTIVYEQAQSHVGEPGKTMYTLKVDQQHFDAFAKVKMLVVDALVDAQGLDEAYQKDDDFRLTITNQDDLRIKVGICADMKAVVDFAKF